MKWSMKDKKKSIKDKKGMKNKRIKDEKVNYKGWKSKL